MIIVYRTDFTTRGGPISDCYEGASYMEVRQQGSGAGILHVFEDESEDRLLALYAGWDYAVYEEDEPEPEEGATVTQLIAVPDADGHDFLVSHDDGASWSVAS